MRVTEGKLQNITFDGNTSEVLIRKRAFNRIIGPFSAIGPLTNRKRQRGKMLPRQSSATAHSFDWIHAPSSVPLPH